MADLDGNVVSTQALVYQPDTTVDLLYPGTRSTLTARIADVPGWILNEDGFWVRDPTDEFLRDGIDLTYTVNPTATATSRTRPSPRRAPTRRTPRRRPRRRPLRHCRRSQPFRVCP